MISNEFKVYVLPISVLMHLLGIVGDLNVMEHDGTYIVEHWWINFIEIIGRYTDYLPKFNNLMAQLVLDYYWWIHVQVWSIIF